MRKKRLGFHSHRYEKCSVFFLQGYDDRYDSDGDRTPPRASRRIPVTDLDEDDYNDPDYYNDNLRKIDTKTKV